MDKKRKPNGKKEEELYEVIGIPEDEWDETRKRSDEEEDGFKGDISDGEKPGNRQWQSAALGFVLAVFLIIIYFTALTQEGKDPDFGSWTEPLETQEESHEEIQTELKTVLLRGTDDKTEETLPETATVSGETADPQAAGGLSEKWQTTIFGKEKTSLLSSIRVSGLSSAMKEKTGYRESDFLNALSLFLQDNNLSGITEVTFEEEVLCSAPDAYAYRADLKGREDKVLTVILYPEYPGRYLLTLQDKQQAVVEVRTQPASEQEAVQQIQPQETYREETAAEEPAQTYDAATLSINEIPATLLNYLGNRYELQYTMYDYLYRQGRSSVTWAEVTGYEIDAETRTALITFRLSDAGSLTCTYDKTNNSYSYR